MPDSFVHLHVHTHYSMLDGACRIGDLVKRVKALGMPAVAITDHGAMHGVIEFYNECKKEGIKPIIGMEAYMAPGDRRERTTHGGNAGDAAYHLLLLAENLEGYRNLIKLSSIAFREGFYYKPRIDKEVLREFSKGIIASSACLGGEVCSAFMKRDTKAARAVAETYVDIFGPDRFFIEVQKQGIKEQDMVNPELEDLAAKLGVGLIATNDVHFLNKDDHHAHDVLCCISMGKQVNDESRLKYPTELYLKSPAEMNIGCGRFDQAMENTLRIAEMCNVEFEFGKKYAPVYRVPTEKLIKEAPHVHAGLRDDEIYLRQLCEEGLKWRYGTSEVSKEIRDRLEYELKIICMKNFCSYFLIVWDFCNYARDNGIPVGARGSGVGTMVGYLLGLCNVDPLKYNLLFERFMDPSRNEMPDIDIDICQDGRQKIIDYVREKYGHVAQIITFGTLAAKAACKDVGRVMGVSLAEVDKITKLIPGTPGMTLKKALDQSPDLQRMYDENPQTRAIIDVAQKLEGLCRNAGCHAAGVIIADQPLENLVPLYRDSDGNILTQFEGPIAEKVGLLKMDFLGLRTLSTLTRALELEKQTRILRGAPEKEKGVPYDADGKIDIESIDYADPRVLALFGRGESRGIFQFESGGMTDLLMKMQPDRLEDLIAANALYRPGPMELIPLYCNRKHKREGVPQVHPIMDKILEETYSIMVYQEQVMQIFNQLGGIELSNAYKLIKAISKKTSDVIAKFKPDFIKGAMANGVSKDKAEEIFELILKFGGYGFNKSHSTRYAIIAYQTAYMKTYHPVEYMAALLTFEMGSTDKVVEYIEECKRMTTLDGTRGVKVLPPDVNVSNVDFTPIYEPDLSPPLVLRGRARVGAKRASGDPPPQPAPGVPGEGAKQKRKIGVIRFGLAAVKGVGEKAVQTIIDGRQSGGDFRSIYEFCERVDLRAVNRSTIEALIKCGAFDSLNARRSQLLAVLDKAVEMGAQMQQDRRSGQLNMFGAAAAVVTTTQRGTESLPPMEEFPQAELLKNEKEVLGFYITSHPLTQHQGDLDRYGSHTTRQALHLADGNEVTLGGIVAAIKKRITKNGRSAGQQMAIVTLEDLEGQIECMVFAETLAELQKRGDLLAPESIVFIKGKIDKRRESPSIVVNDVMPLSDAVSKWTKALLLKLDRTAHSPKVLAEVKPVLKAHSGRIPLYTQVSAEDGLATIALPPEWAVKPSDQLISDLDRLLGNGCAQLIGPYTARRAQQQKLFKEAPSDEPAEEQINAMETELAAAMDE